MGAYITFLIVTALFLLIASVGLGIKTIKDKKDRKIKERIAL